MRTFKYYLLFLIFLSSCSVDNIVDHQTLSLAKLHIPIDGII